MTAAPPTGLRWSTSAFGTDTSTGNGTSTGTRTGTETDTAPGGLCALDLHLQHCQGGHRRLRALGRGAEGLHSFVAPRFISTVALLLLLGALVLAVL